MNLPAGAWCRATFNYSGEAESVPVEMVVRDGRVTPPPDYETSGFRLLEHRSGVTDWHDESHLAEVHSPEVEALAREMLGADRVLVYPPIVRSPRNALKIEDYAPIEFVHSDFTDDFRPMCQEPERPYRAFIEPMLESAGLAQGDIRRASRVVMLQFWRNIGPRRPDFPLGFCDASRVPRSRLHPFLVPEYGGRKLEFETFGVRPPADPAEHHWYGFPELGIDEVVMFRTYDSRCIDEGRAFWTPHSAFRDPLAGADAPRRESLEMRALCLFGV